MLLLFITTVMRCPHCRAEIDRSSLFFSGGLRLAPPMQKCNSCGQAYRDSRCKEWTHLPKSEQLTFKAFRIASALIVALLLPIFGGFVYLKNSELISFAYCLAGTYPFVAAYLIAHRRKEMQQEINLSIKRTSPPPLPSKAFAMSTPSRNASQQLSPDLETEVGTTSI
jgi:hypothetical protein